MQRQVALNPQLSDTHAPVLNYMRAHTHLDSNIATFVCLCSKCRFLEDDPSQVDPWMRSASHPCASSPPLSARNGKRCLPPPRVNYVGQDGNAVLPPPFVKTRPANVRGG